MKRMTLLFWLAIIGIGLAQDDPGRPDSLVIGNLDRSPITARLNQTIAVPVWAKTDDSVAFAFIPLATDVAFISAIGEGGIIPPEYPQCGFFADPIPNQPLQGFTTRPLFWSCILNTAYQWVHIADYLLLTASNPNVIGSTTRLREGYDPRNGALIFGLADGITAFIPYADYGEIYITFFPGDSNKSGTVDGLDVVYLINYLKGYGPAPEPFLSGDSNGDCSTNGLDVVYMVNYLKGIGPSPIAGQCP